MTPRQTSFRRAVRLRLQLLVAPLLVLGACSYELRGRVLADDIDSVQMVDPDDPRFNEISPITGARIVLTRDPGRLNQTEVASAVSDRDGWFTLRPDQFGSGWMEEQWGLRVTRSGFSGVDELISLPFDPKKTRLLVTISRGAPLRQSDPPSGSQLSDEAKQFMSAPRE